MPASAAAAAAAAAASPTVMQSMALCHKACDCPAAGSFNNTSVEVKPLTSSKGHRCAAAVQAQGTAATSAAVAW
jgi:hypothetical protein